MFYMCFFFMIIRLVSGVLLLWLKFSLFVDVQIFLLRHNTNFLKQETSDNFIVVFRNLDYYQSECTIMASFSCDS